MTTQNPDGGYGNPGTPADPQYTTPNPYDAPFDPAAPAEPYTNQDQSYPASVDPYTDSDPSYAAPVEPYTGIDPTYVPPAEPYYGTGSEDDTKSVAKDEAANVKDTAVSEGQQVAGTAKDEAANVAGTAKDEAANVASTAKDEAANVAGTAVQAGQQVAGTAKEEATNVVVEAGGQARDIARQAVSELQTQAGTQQQKVAGLVHSYASELGSLASGEGSSGPITDLAQRAADKAKEVGSWLENREPRDVVQELSSFARRRPGAFLVGAAVAGVVVGRLTRNLAADAKDHAEPSTTGSGYTDSSYTGSSYTADSGYAPSTDAATPTYTDVAPVAPVQSGRYGDLASDDRVVGYDTPAAPTYGDVTR